MSKLFMGFQENSEKFTGIPDEFFRDVLPNLDDINEIKICLYVLWKAYMVGDFGIPFSVSSLLLDDIFNNGLIIGKENIQEVIKKTLETAVNDGILLKKSSSSNDQHEMYFINCPSGKIALSEKKSELAFSHTTLDQIQPNIYQLYQENIGPLTPIIADALKNAEDIYPEKWVREAIQIAVQNNVRRWRYVESILDRWQKEGRDGTDRENDQEDYRRYIKGEYGEIGHH
jgi:DNA replication protein